MSARGGGVRERVRQLRRRRRRRLRRCRCWPRRKGTCARCAARRAQNECSQSCASQLPIIFRFAHALRRSGCELWPKKVQNRHTRSRREREREERSAQRKAHRAQNATRNLQQTALATHNESSVSERVLRERARALKRLKRTRAANEQASERASERTRARNSSERRGRSKFASELFWSILAQF